MLHGLKKVVRYFYNSKHPYRDNPRYADVNYVG